MFGCFYKNELENKMPGMTIENIAACMVNYFFFTSTSLNFKLYVSFPF